MLRLIKKRMLKGLLILVLSGGFIGCALAAQEMDMANFGIQEQAKQEYESPEPLVRPNIEYNAENLRDPFEGYLLKKEETRSKAQIEESISPPILTVEGIIYGGKIPQAIINNKVVKVGDEIEGARVIEINKKGVIVFFGQRQYILPSPSKELLENLEGENKGG